MRSHVSLTYTHPAVEHVAY